jgi:hypothetical protein
VHFHDNRSCRPRADGGTLFDAALREEILVRQGRQDAGRRRRGALIGRRACDLNYHRRTIHSDRYKSGNSS